MKKRIAHIDMDAFFVSIERQADPSLLGKPVAVGGSGKRGVVASASYEAREYGVRSGMPGARAQQLCPHLVFVKNGVGNYAQVSRRVKQVLEQFSPSVDFTSIDEGYIDLTGTERLFGRPLDLAFTMRQRVLEETGCSSSFGIAANRLCAKVANKFAKPGGIIEIKEGRERAFLQGLPLKLLPGAGGKTGERLKSFGITRIGQLLEVGEKELTRSFGMAGADLYLKALGGKSRITARKTEVQRKSVGHERTFANDTNDFDFLQRVLYRLCERCCRTLRDDGLVCKCVTLKIRLADFRTFTRSRTMISSSDNDREVFNTVRELLQSFNLPRVAVRLVGVSLSSLSEECQWGLFSQSSKLWRLYKGIDKIRDHYGFDSVVSGLVMGDESTSRYQGGGVNPFTRKRMAG